MTDIGVDFEEFENGLKTTHEATTPATAEETFMDVELPSDNLFLDDSLSLVQKFHYCINSQFSIHKIWVVKNLHFLFKEFNEGRNGINMEDVDFVLKSLPFMVVRDKLIMLELANNLPASLAFIPKNEKGVVILDKLKATLEVVAKSEEESALAFCEAFEKEICSGPCPNCLIPRNVDAVNGDGNCFENHCDTNNSGSYESQSNSPNSTSVDMIYSVLHELIVTELMHPNIARTFLIKAIPIVINKSEKISDFIKFYDSSFTKEHSAHKKELIVEAIGDCAERCRDDNVLDFYHLFSKICDDRLMNARKLATIQLPKFANRMKSEDDLKNFIFPLYQSFTSDSSKIVRESMLHNLGSLIWACRNINIPEFLIDDYISSVPINHAIFQSTDKDLAYYAAYHFYAVLAAIGPKGWSKLSPIYFLLSRNIDAKVRKPLACSFYHIIKVLSVDESVNVEQELGSSVELFLSDLPDIMFGVLQDFSSIISRFPKKSHLKYFGILSRLIVESGVNWRIRQIIADQLTQLLNQPKALDNYYENTTFIISFFITQAIALMKDSIFSVRDSALKFGLMLFSRLKESSDKQNFTSRIDELAISSSSFERMNYLRIIEKFKESRLNWPTSDAFVQHMMIQDPIPRVQLLAKRINGMNGGQAKIEYDKADNNLKNEESNESEELAQSMNNLHCQ